MILCPIWASVDAGQRHSESSAPSGLSQQYTKLSCYTITNQWINIVSKFLKRASDANTCPRTPHPPILICFFPSDYCCEWSDNERKDLSLPPFYCICCVYFPLYITFVSFKKHGQSCAICTVLAAATQTINAG